MDPSPIFTIDTSSTVTIYFLQTTITLVDNLTVCWGKVLSLCCAGFQVACNTFEMFPSSYWFDNLGFLPRENLLLCCITPCSWGFPTKRSHINAAHHQAARYLLAATAIVDQFNHIDPAMVRSRPISPASSNSWILILIYDFCR